eukprot:m.251400 g.251400  ORF g.251400 m.251400 type:complete len:86 (+) comp15900_c0_seq13:2546-2803(+)
MTRMWPFYKSRTGYTRLIPARPDTAMSQFPLCWWTNSHSHGVWKTTFASKQSNVMNLMISDSVCSKEVFVPQITIGARKIRQVQA